MSVVVSAPGKLVLMGEHAVVYGQPCLVTSVSQRFFLQAEPTETVTLTLSAPQLGVADYRKSLLQLGEGQVPKEVAFVEHAVRRTLQNRHLPHGVHVRTHSEFSALYGFGSSSAAAVCTVEALSQLYGLGLPKEEVFAIAFAAVRDVQKTGSGVDIAAATFGGTIVYEIGGKRLEPIAFPVEEMLVGYTGVKADTVTVLNEVKARSERHPEIFEDLYERMGALVHRYVEEVPDLTLETVGELMDINQGWLETLGVSSQKLASMVHAAREAGAWGAKLSGAGKGDCMLALASAKVRPDIEAALMAAGGQVLPVTLGVEGVRTEASHPAFL